MHVVYSQYSGPVFRFLKSRVGNWEDAEDLTADTFVKAALQLDVSRPDASVASWLFTVARTVLADHWRKHYRYGEVEPIDDVQIASATDAGSPPGRNDGPERLVAQIIDDLPDKYGLYWSFATCVGSRYRRRPTNSGHPR